MTDMENSIEKDCKHLKLSANFAKRILESKDYTAQKLRTNEINFLKCINSRSS